MIIHTFFILADFKDNRIKLTFNPSNCSVLLRIIYSLVLIVWVFLKLLSFFKPYLTFRILSKLFAFFFIKIKSHFSITVIPYEVNK
jgi:hypothetical protein